MGRKNKSRCKSAQNPEQAEIKSNTNANPDLPSDHGNTCININNEAELQVPHPVQDQISRSRTVFVATVCHVCKAVPKDATATEPEVKLSRCGQCLMISYCSREHQVADWKNHKSLCRVIQQVLMRDRKKYLYEGYESSQCNQTEWLQKRCGYMHAFGQELGRDVLPFEKELLLFPRVCFVCHAVSDLVTCTNCHMFTACPRHLFPKEHDHCSQMKLFLAMVTWENNPELQRPSLEAQTTLNTGRELLRDMQGFLSTLSTAAGSSESGKPQDIWLTDVATGPLTILSALKHHPQLLEASCQALTVHIVGAEMDFEGCCSTKWETYLMHLLPQLKLLDVVLIGPELSAHSQPYELCGKCKAKGCDLRIRHFPGVMYHAYCKDSEEYTKPHVICAFNCGIYRTTGFNGTDSWAPTIPLLGTADIVVTTSYTETEGVQDTRRILKECSEMRLVSPCSRNPFRSLRPQRTLINEQSDPMMYKNNFHTIFRKPKQ